jgi:hypothetical protein
MDDLLVGAQLIQIRRDATTEPVPVDVETFDDWTDDLPSQFVEVHMLTRSRVKHNTRLRIAGGTSIRIQNFRQLSNDRDLASHLRVFRLVDQTFPNRAFQVQSVTRIIRPFQWGRGKTESHK